MSSSHTGRAVDRAHPDGTPQTGSGVSAVENGRWRERMQTSQGRHAAITRNLTTWSSYKTWAEQARDAWQEPGAEAAKD